MKKRFLSSSALRLIVIIFAASLLFTSCQKIDLLLGHPKPHTSMVALDKALLSGANEVPANSSKGTGYISGTFDTASMKINITVVWALGNPKDSTKAMHIHHGAKGVSGPVIIPFSGFSNKAVGTFNTTTRALTSEEVTELKNGELYVNVHSTSYPGGELRAQLALH